MAQAARLLEHGHACLRWRCSECDPTTAEYIQLRRSVSRTPEEEERLNELAPEVDESAADTDEAELRYSRNCAQDPTRAQSMDLPYGLTGCPQTSIDRGAFALYLDWKRWASLGVLPFDGELQDQPQYIVEAFELCADIRREAEDKRKADETRAMHQTLLTVLQGRGT